MKCPNHPQNDATGYCQVCGDLGCSTCLKEHAGGFLCPKHYRPVAEKMGEVKRQEEIRRKHPRKLMVVRYKDGRREYGITYALNLRESGFHLDLVTPDGTPLEKTIPIQFDELKAVFIVKSFDGNYDKRLRHKEWNAEGEKLVVEFQDGEVIHGTTLLHYDAREPRFNLVPDEQETNNLSIIVERTAVKGIYTPEQYKAKVAEEWVAQKESGVGPAALTQEETTGDFYFETRNYPAALEQYRLAITKYPEAKRVQKKILTVYYNIGVEHIKRRDYAKALQYMEVVLKTDPHNERVLKKASQLRHIIEKEGNSRASN